MTPVVAPAACFEEERASYPRAHVRPRHLAVAQFEIAVVGDAWYEGVLCVVLLFAQVQAFPCMQQPILEIERWPSA